MGRKSLLIALLGTLAGCLDVNPYPIVDTGAPGCEADEAAPCDDAESDAPDVAADAGLDSAGEGGSQ